MAKKLGPKKQAISDLATKLSMSLPELKTTLGEKKFERRIKKAAKILNAGIKATLPKASNSKKEKKVADTQTEEKA